MKILYNYAYTDLKGCKIGEVMRLDYNTITIGRKRLRGKIFDNTNLQYLVRRMKYNLSILII